MYSDTEAIPAAERAVQLAAQLGLAEPASALGFRGQARSGLGAVSGLDDMRRALALAVEQGLGRAAAVLHNNLALFTWGYEGPRAALALCEEGIDFCERRGIVEAAQWMDAQRLTFIAACGDSERALAEVEAVAAPLEAAASMGMIEARATQLVLLVRRGEGTDTAAAEQVVATARATGEPQMLALAYAATIQLMIACGDPVRARALLEELERGRAIHDDIYYAALLPGLVRSAVAMGDAALATRLVAGVEPRIPLQQHALAVCRAELAEASGDHAAAETAYAEAAARWREFGDLPELAYALLGQGRCLVTDGAPGANELLGEARALFASMGYAPALKETDALLQAAEVARSSRTAVRQQGEDSNEIVPP
jgi:hypothetical protein